MKAGGGDACELRGSRVAAALEVLEIRKVSEVRSVRPNHRRTLDTITQRLG
jgi:hypothetical protein